MIPPAMWARSDRTTWTPEAIELRATGELVRLHYRSAATGQRLFLREGSELTLQCRRADGADRPQLLRRWLLAEGRRVLLPWLEREAQRTGLRPRRVQLRLQSTRWGSCSSRGTISLNAALLLVEPPLVRYLLVHELAHLEHLRHSQRFWDLVERHEPDFAALDRQLGRSALQLPVWLLALTRGAGC